MTLAENVVLLRQILLQGYSDFGDASCPNLPMIP